MTVTVALFETSHFTWHGIGTDRPSAAAALTRAWQEHCKQTPGADPDTLDLSDLNYITGEVGQGFRDYAPLPRPASNDKA